MTIELWATVASVGTLVVIAATAIVAFVQLRHARAGNQIAAILQISEGIDSERMQEARRFLRDELGPSLHDAEFRRQLSESPVGPAARPLILLGNHYERVGSFVKRGIIDEDLACDLWSGQVEGDWERMAPAIAIVRRTQGDAVFENFEYLVDASERWIARHPQGSYPRSRPRRAIRDEWLEEDSALGAVPPVE
jgi:hypothetical protein